MLLISIILCIVPITTNTTPYAITGVIWYWNDDRADNGLLVNVSVFDLNDSEYLGVVKGETDGQSGTFTMNISSLVKKKNHKLICWIDSIYDLKGMPCHVFPNTYEGYGNGYYSTGIKLSLTEVFQ